jgi:hypothetical protein
MEELPLRHSVTDGEGTRGGNGPGRQRRRQPGRWMEQTTTGLVDRGAHCPYCQWGGRWWWLLCLNGGGIDRVRPPTSTGGGEREGGARAGGEQWVSV